MEAEPGETEAAANAEKVLSRYRPASTTDYRSSVRAALDWLLAYRPNAEIAKLELNEHWMLVDLLHLSYCGPERWAIWLRTGAIHLIDDDGAVVDPPAFVPAR